MGARVPGRREPRVRRADLRRPAARQLAIEPRPFRAGGSRGPGRRTVAAAPSAASRCGKRGQQGTRWIAAWGRPHARPPPHGGQRVGEGHRTAPARAKSGCARRPPRSTGAGEGSIRCSRSCPAATCATCTVDRAAAGAPELCPARRGPVRSRGRTRRTGPPDRQPATLTRPGPGSRRRRSRPLTPDRHAALSRVGRNVSTGVGAADPGGELPRRG